MLFTLLPMGRGITPAWAGKSMIVRSVCLSSVDHPRVGGEKIVDFFCMVVIVGSPPRGRGKGRTATTDGKRTGITPAWAGKRSLGCNLAGCTTDHPRVGGEKCCFRSHTLLAWGSPPRGRGKASTARRNPAKPGITPAWAGKSEVLSVAYRCCVDHPRVGGEKRYISRIPAKAQGSPPRGRGKADAGAGREILGGITPAWAGKSRCARLDAGHRRDHPRVGGEKSRVAPRSDPGTGSPPRGRGKARYCPLLIGAVWITPAWAGKSGISHAYRPRPRDHPRVGGEKQMQEQAGKYWVGSPPRGRGKAAVQGWMRATEGITPAWAGKSREWPRGLTRAQDHPRVGGEKS